MSIIGKTILCVSFGAAGLILLAAGCSQSSNTPGAIDAAAKPKEEQSFDLIVATIKRRIQDTPSGFITSDSDGGRSRLMASNTVTSTLIPPSKEGERYRGEVTISSESRYSFQPAADDGADSSKKRDADTKSQKSGVNSLSKPGDDGTDADILDPALVTSSGNGSQGPKISSEGAPIRRKDSEKRTFELEYHDGRWTLLTKPDPKFESAIALAFEEALGSQF